MKLSESESFTYLLILLILINDAWVSWSLMTSRPCYENILSEPYPGPPCWRRTVRASSRSRATSGRCSGSAAPARSLSSRSTPTTSRSVSSTRSSSSEHLLLTQGNYPDSVLVEWTELEAAYPEDKAVLTGGGRESGWRPLLPQSKLGPHQQHRFTRLAEHARVTHIRWAVHCTHTRGSCSE